MGAGLTQLVRHIRRLVSPHEVDGDANLVKRFVQSQDEDAFAALVARHGPMVLRVCQRVLADRADAEDCLQATFLVLARKAPSLRRPAALAGWLHGVALRVASKARKAGYRRRLGQVSANISELPDRRPDPLAQLTARELLVAVDEEVQRLPAAYRLPVILCCLENLTQEEAARRLGWTPGSVKARLERGRKRLEARLAKRGLALPVALVVTAVSQSAATAAVGPGLRAAMVKAAMLFATGLADKGVEATSSAVVLAEATIQGMAVAKLKVLGLMAVICAVAIAGTGKLIWTGIGEKSQGIVTQHKPAPDPEAVQAPAAQNAGPRLDSSGDPLPDGALARLGTTRFRHSNLKGMALSPDGKTAISAGGRSMHFWDLAGGKALHQIEFKSGGPNAVAYSRNGRLAASTQRGGGGSLSLWETATGKLLSEVNLKMEPLCLAFSSDGLTLAVGAFSIGQGKLSPSMSYVNLWQWNGTTLETLWEATPDRKTGGPPPSINSLALSPDSKCLATGGDANGIIRIWDVAQGKEVGQIRASGTVSALAFAPSVPALASGSDDGAVALWERATGIKTWESKQTGQVCALAFAPDGKALAAGGGRRNGSVVSKQMEPFLSLLDPSSGKSMRQVGISQNSVVSVAYSNDGKVLAAGLGNTIRFWDAIRGKERTYSNGHDNRIASLVVSQDAKAVVTSGSDGAVILWDLVSGTERRRLQDLHGTVLLGGKILGTANTDPALRLWDSATGNEILRLEGMPRGVSSIAPDGRSLAPGSVSSITPDGKTLAVANSQNHSIQIWNALTGQPLHTFQLEDKSGLAVNWVNCLAFSPDGNTLATGGTTLNVNLQKIQQSAHAQIVLWDLRTGKKLREFPAHKLGVLSLNFTLDGNTLVSTGYGTSSAWDKRIASLWDVDSGKELRELPLKGGVFAMSPDGKTWALGTWGEISIWEAATHKLRRKFSGHSARVDCLAFSPDGRTLVSGSSDTTALVWDVTGGGNDPNKAASLSKDKLVSLWIALASSDAEEAGRAIWALTAYPKQAVPFIVERLKVSVPGNPQGIPKLVADLDSPIFKIREAAEKDLATLGRLALPKLRETLASQPALEVRRRIEKLLEKHEEPIQRVEVLQTLRALEVLEHIGNLDARQALENVARQAREVYYEQEAKAAAERLRNR